MIKVTVLYPNEEGKKFDHSYWTSTHLNIVQTLLGPQLGHRRRGERSVSGTDPNSPPPFVAIAHLYFNTVEELHSAFIAHASTIMGDIPNYTDIKPQFQISETLL